MTYVQPVINWLSDGNKRNDIRTKVLLQILRQLPLLLSPSLLHWFSFEYLHFFVLFSYTISCHKMVGQVTHDLKLLLRKCKSLVWFFKSPPVPFLYFHKLTSKWKLEPCIPNKYNYDYDMMGHSNVFYLVRKHHK